jgi:hypothetical protein
MRCCRLFLFVTFLQNAQCALAGANDAAQKISLGGPRKVNAEITRDADHLDVAVRMVGVRAFDAATNDRCNREKATSYAHAALKQYLAPHARNVSMRIKGEELIEAGYDGSIFSLVLRVPRDGLTIAEADGKWPARTKRPNKRSAESASRDEEQVTRVGPSGLLTAKQDYLDTIDLLGAKWLEQLPAQPGHGAQAKSFYAAIADAEDGIAADFAALVKEIEADKRLLSMCFPFGS